MGKPKRHIINGKELHTGFIKKPVEQPQYLTKVGFEADGQADLKNHGGQDKALLLYNAEHYTYWEQLYNKEFKYASFGENITINGLSEQDVYIGDIYKLGEATIQVSQPRNPCYKIAEVNQVKDITAKVTETGYSGYYFRVLKEGLVAPTDSLKCIEVDQSKISVSDVQQTLFHDRKDAVKIKQILSVEALADSIRSTLEKRMKKLITK